MKKKNIQFLAISAMLLAIALLLPFLTGQLPGIGAKLCPMHLPVLLCGLLCGPFWGIAVGLVAAPLRFLLFGTPPIPMCLFMAAELAAYGFLSGLLRRFFPKKPLFLILSLILSMIGGRLVYGIIWWIVGTVGSNAFTLPLFLTASFVTPLLGIAIQLVLIPIFVSALERSGIMKER